MTKKIVERRAESVKRRQPKRPARRKVVRASARTTKPLPLKKERTAKAYVGEAAGNKAAAARKGGYKKSTAEKQQARIFKDPKMERRIEELLTDKGLTDERVVSKHSKLLDARTVKFFQAVELGRFTDNDTQLRAVELYYKLKGLLKDRVEIEGVAKAWSERIALVVERCACRKCKSVILDAILGELSTPGAG